MKLKRHSLAILTTSVVALFTAASATHAAVITWNTVGQITADADVSTVGSLVYAYNIGDTGVSNATVNGVTFQGLAIPTGSGGGVFLSDNVNFGSVAPPSLPFTALSTDYKTLLSSATATAQPITFDLDLSSLTVGQTYAFQWWVSYSGTSAQPLGGNTSTLHGATTAGGSTVILDDNTTKIGGVAQEGGLGQWAIGTFTADSTDQFVTFLPVPAAGPNSFAQLNAFQLRDVTPSGGVPETATLLAGMLPVGVLLLGGLVRRRSAAAVKI